MAQVYTSASTSINKNKVPVLYKKAGAFLMGKHVLDYGAGKYNNAIEYALEHYNAVVVPYDPYNRSEEENAIALDSCGSWYDVALCSNVLNVIDSTASQRDVINTMKQHADTLLFTVYEGDGTGKGRQTGTDRWQNNKRLCDYLPIIVDVLGDMWTVTVKNQVIICECFIK